MTEFSAFNSFPYRIYIRDEVKIIYANNAALKYLKKDTQGVVNKNIDELFFDLNYLEHIKRMKKYFFIDGNKNFTSMKELNRCFNKPEMLQIIEYLEDYHGQKVIISILIGINDENYPDKILPLSNIGYYESGSRKVILHNKTVLKLTSLENSLLFLLSKKKSQVISYEEIFLSLDPFNKMDKVSLKSLVFRLNKKINNIIKCESMQGYYIK